MTIINFPVSGFPSDSGTALPVQGDRAPGYTIPVFGSSDGESPQNRLAVDWAGFMGLAVLIMAVGFSLGFGVGFGLGWGVL